LERAVIPGVMIWRVRDHDGNTTEVGTTDEAMDLADELTTKTGFPVEIIDISSGHVSVVHPDGFITSRTPMPSTRGT
jgi:hypothetical protein